MARCHVLLSGGIGAGKSRVAELLVDHGAEVVEADRVGHQILECPEVIREVAERWPDAVSGDGVDRQKLADIVFSSVDELEALESITHPRIRAQIGEKVTKSEKELVVVEMPVIRDLVEGEWVMVVVDASLSVRLERLRLRGMAEEDALARIEAQPSRDEYLKLADHVIDNTGTPQDLEEQVRGLVAELGHCGNTRASFPSGPRMLPQ